MAPRRGDAERPIQATLRAPGVGHALATSLLARLPFAAVTLLLVLRVRELDGSYAASGLVVTAYAVASGVSEPLIARLADRIGQTRVLAVGIPANAGAFALAAVVQTPAALASAAALIGVTYPQVGGMARALLVTLLPDEQRRRAAFALETSAVEILFIAAPALFVATLAAQLGAADAFAIAGVVTAVGSAWFASGRASRSWTPRPRDERDGRPLSTVAYRSVVGVTVVIGAALGTIEVATTAFAEAHGARADVGWLLALSAAGSLVGGIAAAQLRPPGDDARRLATLLVALSMTTALLAVPSTLSAMGLLMAISGATIAPTMAHLFGLTAHVVPPARVTEGYAWLGTGLMIGAALGAAVAGFLTTHGSAATAYVVMTVPAAVGAGLVATRLGQALNARGPAQEPERA